MIGTRREILGLLGMGAAAAALAPGRALALTEAQATDFVETLVAEITALVQSGKPSDRQSEEFSAIFERYAAVPQIARFVMGPTWQEMSAAQQQAFTEALLNYVGRVYSGLLQEYQGQTLQVQKAQDFGRKGVLVTAIGEGRDVEGSMVEFLVSDRGGDGVKVVDIVAEGVSLLQSQRQEFASLLEQRGGDVDRFIADLRSGRINTAG